MIQERINQANGRLRAANVGVVIELVGKRIYLRATLPPKPGSSKTTFHQQRIALGLANVAGVQQAEREARKVGALVACDQFSWQPYLKAEPEPSDSIKNWCDRFELDYFSRRSRNPKSETTWRDDYLKVFSCLPLDKPLQAETLKACILTTQPDTRTRRRFVMVLSRLAKFADLNADFSPLIGNYSPKRVSPRNLPSDRLIADWFERLPNTSWRWAYGMLATYGIRGHELFYADLSRFPILVIGDGKTGQRRIWPIYPEWAERWDLASINLPQCTGRNNSDLGNRVTHAFKRLDIPFRPYDLRHAWAVRSLEFGLDITLAAAQMGHSPQVHSDIYHQWISEDVHQRAYELLMNRSDRPQAP